MTQEMVYLIKTLDFQTAASVQLDDRFPLIDYKNEHFHYYRGKLGYNPCSNSSISYLLARPLIDYKHV